MNVPGAKPSLKMLRSSHWLPEREGAQRKVVCTAFDAVPKHCDSMIPGPIAAAGTGGGGGGLGVGVGPGVRVTVGVGVRVVAADARVRWLTVRQRMAEE